MARVCTICGKKSVPTVKRKKLRSRYNPTNRKKSSPNLHRITVTPFIAKKFPKLNLTVGKKILVCTKCLKSLLKEK